MRDFAVDTAVTGGDGRFTAILHEDWSVWGPFGGYRGAILLRAEWLFCDAAAPIAGAGLAACHGRVWSPAGRLLASGISHLICRSNPQAG
ncbi:MAG TPA: hypothetical protein VL049_06090 [Candidatus Dormibacteraeota bacterium]|nr:hypothetical protein [Candidatus Dormibacteraeota bacterium]